MSTVKTIAVIGATGGQGGGLARAIAADDSGEFVAPGITRNPDSPAAHALTGQGVEVVQADIEHAIWSTLEDTRRWIPLDDDRMPTLNGHYKVPHFDAKGVADAYFQEIGVPTTWLLTSFYWDNLIGLGMGPQVDEEGVAVFNLPMADKKLPGIAVEDIGRCALGIFRQSSEWVGKRVGISGEQLTGEAMAAALTRALGREVRYNAVPFEVYRGLGFPGAEDLGNMFQFKADFEDYYCGARDPEVARRLNPQLQTFSRWLDAHAGQIEIG